MLEEASSVQDAFISSDPIFGGDLNAMVTAKQVALESMLKLLVRDLKFTDFMREILMVMMKVVKSEAGSILEVDHKNNNMFFRATAGQSSDTITKFTVPMGQGIAGYVAESMQPLIVANIKENQMHLKAIEKAVGFETRNLVAVPLVIRGKIFGVLELLNRVGDENYSDNDIELLNYLCEMSAKAIEVRLMLSYAASQRRDEQQGDAA